MHLETTAVNITCPLDWAVGDETPWVCLWSVSSDISSRVVGSVKQTALSNMVGSFQSLEGGNRAKGRGRKDPLSFLPDCLSWDFSHSSALELGPLYRISLLPSLGPYLHGPS